MDAHESADRPAERPDRHPGRVATPGIAFEVSTAVTGTRVQVEVQMPDRRAQVIFGSLYGSFLILRLSDPDETVQLGHKPIAAGEQLAHTLTSAGAGDG